MLVLAAKCIGKPEARSEIVRLASVVAPLSRDEAGCIAYDFYAEPSGSNEYIFFEEWADQAALDFHFQTPHFQEFIRDFSPLLAGPPSIRTYDVREWRDLEM
jgi:quinol monooxygenase YgiN